jgi:hypothetical protein
VISADYFEGHDNLITLNHSPRVQEHVRDVIALAASRRRWLAAGRVVCSTPAAARDRAVPPTRLHRARTQIPLARLAPQRCTSQLSPHR